MKAKRIRKWVALTMLFAVTGCAGSGEDTAPAPSPEEPLRQLLALHGLLGRSLDERPEAFKKAAINRAALEKWVLDYSEEDPFLADLYVGFVVGATAANQHSMETTVHGARAEVKVGRARIVLHLSKGLWRISLGESVPEAVKARAKMEKLRVAENASILSR